MTLWGIKFVGGNKSKRKNSWVFFRLDTRKEGVNSYKRGTPEKETGPINSRKKGGFKKGVTTIHSEISKKILPFRGVSQGGAWVHNTTQEDTKQKICPIIPTGFESRQLGKKKPRKKEGREKKTSEPKSSYNRIILEKKACREGKGGG